MAIRWQLMITLTHREQTKSTVLPEELETLDEELQQEEEAEVRVESEQM